EFIGADILQNNRIRGYFRLEIVGNLGRLPKGQVPETFQVGTRRRLLRARAGHGGQRAGGGERNKNALHPSVLSKKPRPIGLPAASLAERSRKKGLPSRAGQPSIVMRSPAFTLARVHPRRISTTGAFVSLRHSTCLPCSSTTSITSRPCGLVKRKLFTVPSRVMILSPSK